MARGEACGGAGAVVGAAMMEVERALRLAPEPEGELGGLPGCDGEMERVGAQGMPESGVGFSVDACRAMTAEGMSTMKSTGASAACLSMTWRPRRIRLRA